VRACMHIQGCGLGLAPAPVSAVPVRQSIWDDTQVL